MPGWSWNRTSPHAHEGAPGAEDIDKIKRLCMHVISFSCVKLCFPFHCTSIAVRLPFASAFTARLFPVGIGFLVYVQSVDLYTNQIAIQ